MEAGHNIIFNKKENIVEKFKNWVKILKI